ncbi:uncharacterized protein BJX67DRAFT_177423 [Aspergillus lucknowensis]|uniref:Uncharacterized protein n=1 Tax=Aspergillus lucknowensis TaxID=176173 RepID=A0ABR4LLV9_9EURO
MELRLHTNSWSIASEEANWSCRQCNLDLRVMEGGTRSECGVWSVPAVIASRRWVSAEGRKGDAMIREGKRRRAESICGQSGKSRVRETTILRGSWTIQTSCSGVDDVNAPSKKNKKTSSRNAILSVVGPMFHSSFLFLLARDGVGFEEKSLVIPARRARRTKKQQQQRWSRSVKQPQKEERLINCSPDADRPKWLGGLASGNEGKRTGRDR